MWRERRLNRRLLTDITSERQAEGAKGSAVGEPVEREYATESKRGETIETPGCVRDGMRVSLRVLEGESGGCGVSEGVIDAY